MAERIGWHFPPTNGGQLDGFNSPGMAHFTGDPLVSLARETIQNSLDAKSESDGPVHMEFAVESIDRLESLGREELAASVRACLGEVADSEDEEKAHKTLTEAASLLEGQALPYLRVADQNTTGLNGRHWKALVKMQGASVKDKPGAGGSHGIGKYAPFAVSPLRTVFYWTRCNGVERFQGKAVLMSHQSPNGSAGESQGTGFFGYVDGCRELAAADVPERIRRVEHGDGQRSDGTSLWIAGFRTTGAWQPQIARSVVSNFFHAIENEMLCVVIDPNQDMTAQNLCEISKTTLGQWLEYLTPSDESKDEDGDIAEARQFWEITRDSQPCAEKEDRDLGRCRLWIRVAEGLPSKVGFVRGNGMLITTEQRGLIQFRGLNEFLAVCVFDAPKGNELLRRMENPQHNQFEPRRLPDDGERRKGAAALRRITDWIRDEIRTRASPPAPEQVANLDELARYLPDLAADDPIDHAPSAGDSEQLFDESAVLVRLKPRRSIGDQRSRHGEEDDEGGDGDDLGEFGGGGTEEGSGGGGNGGRGEGDGHGGSGVRGGESRGRPVPVSDVRIVPVPGSANRYRVSFSAKGSGIVSVEFGEAGDSSSVTRTDVAAYDQSGSRIDLTRVELVAGVRSELEITAEDAIGDRAWRVLAVEICG